VSPDGSPTDSQSSPSESVTFLEKVEISWNQLVSKDRDLYFLAAIVLSSLVGFLPNARDTSVSNFLVYSLLLIVLVFANRERFKRVSGPSWDELIIATLIIAGSFAFNWVVGAWTGDKEYGLTDYVILSIGLFFLFYSLRDALVRFGALMLVIVRGGTLALSVASASLFAAVSAAFVGIVVLFSRIMISSGISSGSIPGEVVIDGPDGVSRVFIGWACAGLEELVIITVMIYILIESFQVDRKTLSIWMVIGVIGSFAINIARMVMLVWIAYRFGLKDMLWVHTHLGDVLFLVWIGIFWLLFFKFSGQSGERVRKTSG